MKKIFFVILSFIIAVPVFGQEVTSIPSDVRTAGMGDAYTAMYGKGFSIYTNSAAAALSDDDFAVSANYTMWQPKMISMNNFAIGAFYKFSDRYTVGIGARGLMQPLGKITDSNGQAIMDGGTSTKISAEVSFGMRIIEGFAAAVNVHFFYSMLAPDVTGIGYAADLDLMYSHKYFNVALSAKNLGPAMKYAGNPSDLPMDIRLGYSGDYEVVDDILDITPAFDVNYLLNNKTLSAGIGAEFEFIDMVSLRGGYRYSANDMVLPSYATVGVGVEFFNIALDAAYYIGLGSAADILSNSFKVGLSYRF